MSAPPFAKRVTALISRFRRDKKANIAVIFAIALIPILTALGCAVDYSLATRLKAKLQSAADGASVAAIAKNSLGYIQASTMTSDGEVLAGETDALNVFNGNMSTISGYTFSKPPTATVTKTGIKLTSVVQFNATMPTTFLSVVGFPSLSVSGSSSSTASFPPYLDIYLMLDVLGSMGLPSTGAEQGRLAGINPDNYSVYPNGCTFACHFSGQSCNQGGTNGGQKYNTNYSFLGYAISRVSPPAYANLIQKNSGRLPSSMISGLPNSLYTDTTWGLPPVSSCP